VLNKAEAITNAAAAAGRSTFTAEETRLFDTHMAEANRLATKIEHAEDNNSLLKMFRGGQAGAIMDAGRPRPIESRGRIVGREAPDMGRFQAEFHDWVNTSLGSPWPRMTADTDTPIYIGTGTGMESVGFTVPKPALPYLP